jgi:hypothetical protein
MPHSRLDPELDTYEVYDYIQTDPFSDDYEKVPVGILSIELKPAENKGKLSIRYYHTGKEIVQDLIVKSYNDDFYIYIKKSAIEKDNL